MTPPASCPDPSRWSALLAGGLPDAEVAFLNNHLETCAACRAARDGPQVKNASTEATLVATPVAPESAASALSKAPESGTLQPRPPRRRVLKRTLAWCGRFLVRFLFGGPRWRRALVWSVLLAGLFVASCLLGHWWQFQQGYDHAAKGEHDQAIACFTTAIRLYPWNPVAYNNRGAAWSARHEYDKAIADYTEAIRLYPQYANAYYWRGPAWHDKKEYDKAIADYTEAIRLNPQYANAYRDRGSAWRAKKDDDLAIADYTDAIRLNPQDVSAYGSRGAAWYDRKEYDKAIADCNEAIRLDPQLATAYNYRGRAWEAKGDQEKADADFQEAERLRMKKEV